LAQGRRKLPNSRWARAARALASRRRPTTAMVAETPPMVSGNAEREPDKSLDDSGKARQRQLISEVPKEALPGESKLSFDVGDEYDIIVPVPLEANPGDKVVLTENANTGEWSCSIVRRTVTVPVAPPVEEEGGASATKSTVLVPMNATPGKTCLNINAGGQTVAITVPAGATVGDKLTVEKELTKEGREGWVVTLERHRLAERSNDGLEAVMHLAEPQAQPLDENIAFEELVAACRDAGCIVSPKMVRGSAAPLWVPGMIARETIEEGELLCRIPQRLHISPEYLEAVVPELHKAVQEVEGLPVPRRPESLQAIFLAHLLQAAEDRAVARCNGADRPKEGTGLPVAPAVEPEVLRVWESYADGLLNQDFAYHPYRRAATDPRRIKELMAPSPEADYCIDMAQDIVDVHRLLQMEVPEHLLGKPFDPCMFLRGRLCILTRIFLTSYNCTLVPIVDLLNHQPGKEPSSTWEYRADEKAMVLTASRAHAAGEEIFDSYGPRSNALFLRTYGFTQPPAVEPSWTYQVRSDKVLAIYEAYLTEEMRKSSILLDSMHIEDSLSKALHAAHAGGGDAGEFLLMLCGRCVAAYERDERLRPAREALARARAADPTDATWWDYLAEEDAHLEADESTRVNMSEFLCLTAHIEALHFAAGRLPAESCLREAWLLLELLPKCLQTLREAGAFAVVVKKDGEE